MNNLDSYDPRHRRIHSGFLVGMIAAAIMIAVHLFFLLIFQWTNRGDWIAWGIQLVVYFFSSQVAAQRHYDAQERSPEALRGVRAAGVGAALTTSLIIWACIVVRWLLQDAFGISVMAEPFGLLCRVPLDVLAAIGIGTWGGRIVEKKYGTFEGYRSD
jgi:hypothetical protein